MLISLSASNIAIKINTKLSTANEKAVSWQSSGTSGIDAIDWIGEAPTLVIGIGLASGMGNAAETVVSASTAVDGNCMRLAHSCFVQEKSDGIVDHVIENIVKESWRMYCSENDGVYIPERVLVYRDSMSDGDFTTERPAVDGKRNRADDEISCIRRVLNEVDDRNLNLPISECD